MLDGRINGVVVSLNELGSNILTSSSGGMDDDGNTVLENDEDTFLRLTDVIRLIIDKFRIYDARHIQNEARFMQLEADVVAAASVPRRTVLYGTYDLHTVFSGEFYGVDTHHSLDLEHKNYLFGILSNDWDRIYNNKGIIEILSGFFVKNYIHTRMAPGRIYPVMTVLRQKWNTTSVAVRLAGKGGLPPSNVDFYDSMHTYQSAEANMKASTQVDDGDYTDGEISTVGRIHQVEGQILAFTVATAVIAGSYYFAGGVGHTFTATLAGDIFTSLATELATDIAEFAGRWAKDYLIRDGILRAHRQIKSTSKLRFTRNDEKQYYDKAGVMLSKIRTTSYSERFDGFHRGRPSAKAYENPLVGGAPRAEYEPISTSRKIHTMSSAFDLGFGNVIHFRHHSLANIYNVKIKHQDWVNDPRYTITFDNDINRSASDTLLWKSGTYGTFDRAEGDAYALNGLLIAAYDYTTSSWWYYNSSGNWAEIP
jgi:hypothetical protein